MRKIYFNGDIITVNDKEPIVDAVLVENGKIIKTGSKEEILKLKNEDTELVDLDGKTMLPGFIDSHSHIIAVAQTLMIVNLSDANSKEEFIAILKDYVKNNPSKNGEWIIGFGYDNTRYENEEHPTKFDLDLVTKDIPIFISHASGHIATTNSKALEAFGYVGTNYEVPEGGVVRTVGESNEPNGILEENACLSPEKRKVIPTPSVDTLLSCIKKAQQIYSSYGLTTAQDASIDENLNQLLNLAAQKNELIIDIVGQTVQHTTLKLLKNEGTPKRKYYNHYKLLGGKTWLDGSPQGKTAWLTKPYYEVPEGESKDYCGYATQEDKDVIEYFKSLIENNIQVNVHCNGDAASDQFIRCYKKALEMTDNKTDLRPVMVHAQTVREDQLDDMKELGIIPTFFLDHIWFWGDYHYESVFGPERANRLSPAKSALRRNINFTLHQDSPVKMPNQILAMHNAVNRQTQSGRILGADQRLSTMEAIKALTINAAYQYFEEDEKGSIEEGKVADFVILDRNPLDVNLSEIKEIKVLETIKEGNTIYKK
ncbi:amidohydrolase [Romboutsia sp. 1001216sp1]|uniref:amidohydrolase n=1 Tax=Romboutsia sp. 1001216sp1 TaxID=2986997 RepID=UPI00232D3B82|nr:amidohydrolase [Romboutsia sp. 1001216sp1]MDB8805312.1 amidohydrolase [Romboutsia sp. 1001216sp1]MDB8807014.1 amidohydrolase [Romboutsia sp. 1001216sp1]MDB8810957.1 amidohydrolase [Romboutsia sp. 1001216sp1]MDB8816677.1 amidohydrolase [Romboutsia sp. 1001216sp1]MDB8819038.1 amidohydrolase [Romboutsia sp. 1001216sp1]